jgi:ATP adenylyltransferase
VMKPDGFNVGINLGKVAGAGIAEHLHIHVVPRWNGDTNFMPVIANTGVVPQALIEVAAKLRAELGK